MGLQDELNLPNPITDLPHEVVLNIVLSGQLLAKEGDRLLRPFGLTDSQFNVLMLLKYQVGGEGINQTQLGRMLLVNRSNVTGLIDRMEQAGWVDREGEAGDRRVKRIALTEAGNKLAEQAEQVYFAQIHSCMSDLSLDEHHLLCSLLERIRQRLR